MNTVPLTIRRCPVEVHQALKKRAAVNRRSLNAEVLNILEDDATSEPFVTGAELAKRLRRAQKLLSRKERLAFAEDIQRGIDLMRHERLH